MNKVMHKYNYIPFKVLAVSCLVVWISFSWQGNKGINLGDEGFLWYGVQRVLLGEVPIRDFMSYDPGRYYWSAALVSVFGDHGVMSLRAAVAVFQALGLFVGSLLLMQSERLKGRLDVAFLLISTVALLVWMYPRHKLFDISISIFLVASLAYLVNKPVARRYFWTGGCVGLVAVFGRNHGAYALFASLGVIIWLNLKRTTEPPLLKAILYWVGGVVVGYLPILFMLAFVPGFAVSFYEGLAFLFERGTTNLTLPVPWFWTVPYNSLALLDGIRSGLIGLFFLGLIIFAFFSLCWVTFQRFRGRAVCGTLVASAFLAFPYAHYAFSRADIGHLAQGIFPLLIGCFAILANKKAMVRYVGSSLLCAVSLLVMIVFQPGWQCSKEGQCVDMDISGSTLQVASDSARDIEFLRGAVSEYAKDGSSFVVTPFCPAAYALFEKKSPMWAVYSLWKRGSVFEEREIERIKAADPRFVVILDFALDGREDMRFRNTHPLINTYFERNFSVQRNVNGWILLTPYSRSNPN